MKKYVLVLLTFVPSLVGYLFNYAIFIPVIGMILLYILPILIFTFWFWLGMQYSKTDWGAVRSTLIGSATGIISLALYAWQFLGQSDETRNMTLAGLSQMYAVAICFFFAKIATMLEPQFAYVGQLTKLAMQAISIAFMIAIFTIGYFLGKRHQSGEKS